MATYKDSTSFIKVISIITGTPIPKINVEHHFDTQRISIWTDKWIVTAFEDLNGTCWGSRFYERNQNIFL